MMDVNVCIGVEMKVECDPVLWRKTVLVDEKQRSGVA